MTAHTNLEEHETELNAKVANLEERETELTGLVTAAEAKVANLKERESELTVLVSAAEAKLAALQVKILDLEETGKAAAEDRDLEKDDRIHAVWEAYECERQLAAARYFINAYISLSKSPESQKVVSDVEQFYRQNQQSKTFVKDFNARFPGLGEVH